MQADHVDAAGADSPPLRIGTAGWSIPRETAVDLAGEGTHLARYARLFDAAEINSSFHRSHRASTYQRWAASVPPHFRFSVKLPKTITHQRKLVDCRDLLAAFAREIAPLAARRGPVLVQMPPSLVFAVASAGTFFADVVHLLGGSIACEPRHPTWFTAEADRLLADHGVARVAADPAVVDAATRPGGWAGLAYVRLHGAPVIYRSPYADDVLDRLAADMKRLHAAGAECWTVFDNTASGAALPNALALRRRLTG